MPQGPSGGSGPGSGSRFASQLGPLSLLTGIFFLNFLSRIIFSPLLPAVEKDLGATHAEAGSFFLMISIGYFVSLLGSGFVSCRLTHRRTILLSAAAVGASMMFVGFSTSVWTVRLSLLLLGLAAGLYLPSGIASLTGLVPARHWGKAIAVHELAPNLGFFAAPLLAEGLLKAISWRGVAIILGAACVLAALAYSRFGKGGRFPGDAPTFGAVKTLGGSPAFCIVVAVFCLGISGSLGVYTMLPLYLVAERGIDRHWANTLVAFSRATGLGMAFLAGWLNDRFGLRWTLTAVLLVTGAATITLGAGPTPWVIAMVFVQPAAAVCFFPPGFAALSAAGPPRLRNMAVSIAAPVAFMVGGGAVPAGIGIMGDATSFGLGIALVGVLILSGAGLSFLLKPSRLGR